MDFVKTKFFYKNHILDLNLKNENMSKKGPRKRKKCKMNSSTQKCFTLKNVWKINFKKLTQKLINFEAFYIEKYK